MQEGPSPAAWNVTIALGVVRAPMLSVDHVLTLLQADDLELRVCELIDRYPVLEAIRGASPSLHEALQKWKHGGTITRRALSRAVAYILRMAWQTTPFGLFASVGTVNVGRESNLRLSSEIEVHRHASTEAVETCIATLKASGLPDQLRIFTSQQAFRLGRRLVFANASKLHRRMSSLGAYYETSESTANATAVIELVIDRSRNGSRVADLIDVLRSEGFRDDDARTLLARLVESGLLITELDHPLVGDYVDDIIAVVKRAYPEKLGELKEAISSSIECKPRITVVRDTIGTIGDELARDIEAFASLHLALSGRTDAVSLKSAFRARYEGSTRMVPLLELLSHAQGVGLRAPVALAKIEEPHERDRNLLLGEIGSRALCQGLREVILTSDDIARLIRNHPPKAVPSSLEIGIQVAATSVDEVARGNYSLVSSPFVAGPRAGASVARFLDLFPDHARNTLKGLHAESAEVEVVCAPPEARLRNVMLRPALGERFLPIGVAPVAGASNLRADKILIGLDEEDEFFLWSEELGARVEPIQNHVFHAAHFGPEIARFLALVGTGARLDLAGISLARLADLAYFPRLRFGRFVLCRAAWRIRAEVLRDADRRRGFREMYKMPHIVVLVSGDHRLPVDLENSACVDLVEAELRNRSLDSALFEELYPEPEECPIRVGDEVHAAEFIFSAVVEKGVHKRAARCPRISRTDRRRTPGSDWIYVKWYCGAQADGVIRRQIPHLLERVKAAGSLASWHFLRYADSRPHLRVRFQLQDGEAAALRAVLEHSQQAVESGDVETFSLETFEREFERYGGERAEPTVDALFMQSSEVALRELQGDSNPVGAASRIERAVRTAVQLVSTADGVLDERLRGALVSGRAHLGGADREIARRIAASLDDQPPTGLVDTFAALGFGDEETCDILSSVLHLHYNRFGLSSEHERDARNIQWHVTRSRALKRHAAKIASTSPPIGFVSC